MNTQQTDSEVYYRVDYKTPYGKYHSVLKKFNNEKHFNNWYSHMSGKGYKIIGVHNPSSYELQ